jgi:LPS-assembly lipoprotein
LSEAPRFGNASRAALLAAAALAASACGFQLRGQEGAGVAALYVSADRPSQVAIEMKRQLVGTPTKLAVKPQEAEAAVRILAESTDKTIQSLTGAGRVFDYRLTLKVSYQITAADGKVLAEPTEVELWRIITYSETAPLAKEAEEQLLYVEMRTEAATRILRRVALVRGGAPPS